MKKIFFISLFAVVMSGVCWAQTSETKSAKLLYTPDGNGYSVEIAFDYYFIWRDNLLKINANLKEEKPIAYHFYCNVYDETDLRTLGIGSFNSPKMLRENLTVAAFVKTVVGDTAVEIGSVSINALSSQIEQNVFFNGETNFTSQNNLNELYLSDMLVSRVNYSDYQLENRLTAKLYNIPDDDVMKKSQCSVFSEDDWVKILTQYANAKSGSEDERQLTKALFHRNRFYQTKTFIDEQKQLDNMPVEQKADYEMQKANNKLQQIREKERLLALDGLKKFHEGIVLYDNQKYAAAFKNFSEVANMDCELRASAYFRIGKMYEEGKGTMKNLNEALNFYQQAMSKNAFMGYENDYARVEALISGVSEQEIEKYVADLAVKNKAYDYIGYSGDARAYLGVTFGTLESKKVAFYASVRVSPALFTKKGGVKIISKETVDVTDLPATNEFDVTSGTITIIKGKANTMPAGNLSVGFTKQVVFPVWFYAGINVAYDGVPPIIIGTTTTWKRIDKISFSDERNGKSNMFFGIDTGLIYQFKKFYLNAGIRTHFQSGLNFVSFGGGYVF